MQTYYHNQNDPRIRGNGNYSEKRVIFGPQMVDLPPLFKMHIVKHYNRYSMIHSRVNAHQMTHDEGVALRNCAKSCYAEWVALGGCFKDPSGNDLPPDKCLEHLFSCLCHTNWINIVGVNAPHYQYPYRYGYHPAPYPYPTVLYQNRGPAPVGPGPRPAPTPGTVATNETTTHTPQPDEHGENQPHDDDDEDNDDDEDRLHDHDENKDFDTDLTSAVASAMAANPVHRRTPSPRLSGTNLQNNGVKRKTFRVVSVPSKGASRLLSIKKTSHSSNSNSSTSITSCKSENDEDEKFSEGDIDKINPKILDAVYTWTSCPKLQKQGQELLWIVEASKFLTKDGQSRMDYIKEYVSINFRNKVDVDKFSSVGQLVRDYLLGNDDRKYEFIEKRRLATKTMRRMIEEQKILNCDQYAQKCKRRKLESSISKRWNRYENNEARNKTTLQRGENVYLSRTVESQNSGSSALICQGGKFMGSKAVSKDLTYCHILMEDAEDSFYVERVDMECVLTTTEIHKLIDGELKELDRELKVLEQIMSKPRIETQEKVEKKA